LRLAQIVPSTLVRRNRYVGKTERWKSNPERGVALLLALFALLLLSAIAASLMFMTNTETSVNTNYRSERVSAFAAKAGMEEIRARMPALNTAAKLPTTLPPRRAVCCMC